MQWKKIKFNRVTEGLFDAKTTIQKSILFCFLLQLSSNSGFQATFENVQQYFGSTLNLIYYDLQFIIKLKGLIYQRYQPGGRSTFEIGCRGLLRHCPNKWYNLKNRLYQIQFCISIINLKT